VITVSKNQKSKKSIRLEITIGKRPYSFVIGVGVEKQTITFQIYAYLPLLSFIMLMFLIQ